MTNACKYYRNVFIENGFVPNYSTVKDSDECILQEVELNYNAYKAELASLQENSVDFNRIEVCKVAIYVLSLVLLTYGRLDVVADILKYYPRKASLGFFKSAIAQIVPLPQALSPLHNSQAVLSWIEDHKHELHWEEERGYYLI